jgi:hypothetical protein
MKNKPNFKIGNLPQPDPLATNRSPAVAKAISFSQIYVPVRHQNIEHREIPIHRETQFQNRQFNTNPINFVSFVTFVVINKKCKTNPISK